MSGQLDVLKKAWNVLKNVPGGKRVFSFAVGYTARYTGTIRPKVLELEPGRARIAMDDTPLVRNHLRSVHAIALANLVEVTGNLALAYGVPDGCRFIVTGLDLDYVKKARGRIIGECDFTPPDNITENIDTQAEVLLKDSSGDVVVRGICRCKVGPNKG